MLDEAVLAIAQRYREDALVFAPEEATDMLPFISLYYGIMGTLGQATGKLFQAAVFGEFGISIPTAMASIPASNMDDWHRYVNINFHCFNIHVFYSNYYMDKNKIYTYNYIRFLYKSIIIVDKISAEPGSNKVDISSVNFTRKVLQSIRLGSDFFMKRDFCSAASCRVGGGGTEASTDDIRRGSSSSSIAFLIIPTFSTSLLT